MAMSLITRLRGLVLIACLAVSIGMAGFGHRAPMQQDARAAALLLSGFAMADLCGLSGSDKAASAVPCLACTPPGPMLVPALPCMVRPAELRAVAVVFAPRARQTVAVVHDPARAPRAPPLV